MSIVELINHVGQENVAVQFLAHCMTGARVRGRGRQQMTEVSFLTEEMTPGDVVANIQGQPNPNEKVGIVIWMPRDKVPK